MKAIGFLSDARMSDEVVHSEEESHFVGLVQNGVNEKVNINEHQRKLILEALEDAFRTRRVGAFDAALLSGVINTFDNL